MNKYTTRDKIALVMGLTLKTKGCFVANKILALLLKSILLCTLIVTNAKAEEFFNNFRWNGYISQSAIYTSDNNFFGQSGDSISFDYTELQLLVSTTFLRNFQFSGSLLSRRAGEIDDGKPRIDHAFIDYTIFNNLDWMFSARAGRIKYPIGFYGETRDVAFTRPSLLLPQVLYVERFRDLLYTADGIGTTIRRSWGVNDLTIDLVHSTFKNEPDAESFDEVLQTDVSGDIFQNSCGAARILFSHDGGRFRAGLTHGSVDYDINNMVTPYGINNINIFSAATVLSAEYNAKKYEIVGEYALLRNKVKNAHPFPDIDTDGIAYYLQGRYRLTDKWEFLLRGEALFMDKDDKYGEQFHAFSVARGQPISAHSRYAKGAVFGIGWHATSSILARLEYSYNEGTGWLPAEDNTNNLLSKHWQMVIAQVSYRF